jgi:hypothetical protein
MLLEAVTLIYAVLATAYALKQRSVCKEYTNLLDIRSLRGLDRLVKNMKDIVKTFEMYRKLEENDDDIVEKFSIGTFVPIPDPYDKNGFLHARYHLEESGKTWGISIKYASYYLYPMFYHSLQDGI